MTMAKLRKHYIWVITSVPRDVVLIASPVTEEGESYPEVNPKKEKHLLKSAQKAQGRSYPAFSHIVNESKTHGDAEDAVKKIEAVPVCYIERYEQLFPEKESCTRYDQKTLL